MSAPSPFSGELFRALVENSYDAVVLLDATGVIQFASQSTATVLGYRPRQLVGRPVLELVHPDDRPQTESLLASCLAEPGRSVRAEYRARHADGSWRHLEGVGVNRLDDPTVQAIVANFRDVTDRMHAHAALRASEQRYALAIDSVGVSPQPPLLAALHSPFAAAPAPSPGAEPAWGRPRSERARPAARRARGTRLNVVSPHHIRVAAAPRVLVVRHSQRAIWCTKRAGHAPRHGTCSSDSCALV